MKIKSFGKKNIGSLAATLIFLLSLVASLFAVLPVTPAHAATPTRTQGSWSVNTSCGLSSSISAGSLIIAAFLYPSTVTFSSISDTASNVWTAGPSLTTPQSYILKVFYVLSSVSSSSDTVAISFSANPPNLIFLCEVYSGVSFSFDTYSSGVNSGSTDTSLSVTSYTPTTGDLIIAIGALQLVSAGTLTWTAGSGYTLGVSTNTAGSILLHGATEYIISWSGGTTTSPFTVSVAGYYSEFSLAFKWKIPVSLTFNAAPNATPLSASNYFAVSYTSGGSAATANCFSTCSFTADPSTTVTIPATSSASTNFEKWCLQYNGVSCTGISLTVPSSGSLSQTYIYYDLISVALQSKEVGASSGYGYVFHYLTAPLTASSTYNPSFTGSVVTPSILGSALTIKGSPVIAQSSLAPTILQKVTTTGTGSLTLTFNQPINTGSVIVVAIGQSGATGVNTITDSLSNTYTLINSLSSRVFVYYTTSSTGGADTITITWSGTPSNGAAAVAYEIADLATSGITSVTASGTGTAIATAAKSYQYGNFLVSVTNWATTSATFTAGSGFTSDYSAAYTGIQSALVTPTTQSTTTFPATLSASATWYTVGVVFPAPSGDTSTTQYSASQLTYGLVGYWPLDEATSGTCTSSVYDLSPYYNTGTCLNSPTFTTGKFGGALGFNGVNSWVQVNSNNLIPRLTVTGWYKTTSTLGTIFSITTNPANGAAPQIDIGLGGVSNNQLEVNLFTNTGNFFRDPSTSNDGNWHQFALSYDGSTAKLYRDGNLVATLSLSYSYSAWQQIAIGAGEGQGYGVFNGYEDDIRLYNRILSASEIQELYASTIPVLEQTATAVGQTLAVTYYQQLQTPAGFAYSDISQSGLVAYWPLDEQTSGVCTSSILDASGNGLTGNCVNSPVYAQGKFGSGLQFSAGSSQYVSIPSSTSFPTSAISVSAWVYLTSNTATNYYNNWFMWGNLLISFTATSNNVDVFADTAHYTTTSGMSSGTWHYIVVAWAGTSLNVYIDGASALSTTTSSSFSGETGNMILGSRTDAPAQGLTGYLDEIQIYNYALTQNQVSILNTHIQAPSPTLSYTSFGSTISQTLTSTVIMPTWQDANTAWSLSNPLTSGSNSWYASSTQLSGKSGTTAYPLYILRYGLYVSYVLVGGGLWNPPVLTYIYNGAQQTLTLTGTAQQIQADSGTTWSVTQSLSPASLSINTNTERAYTNQATSGVVSSTTLVFTYYHQFLVPFSFTVVPSTQAYTGAPTITVVRFGSTVTQTLTTTPTGIWADAGTQWRAQNPWNSGANSFIPMTADGIIWTFGTIQNENPVVLYYQLQPKCVGTNPLILMENGCFVGAIFYVYYNLIGTFFAALILGVMTLAIYIKTDNGLLSVFLFLIGSFILGSLFPPQMGALIVIAVALVLTYMIAEMIRS